MANEGMIDPLAGAVGSFIELHEMMLSAEAAGFSHKDALAIVLGVIREAVRIQMMGGGKE